MIADVVTLDEVLAAAAGKRASLVPETSGYLALAVGDATERLPFRVEDRAVTLTTEGSVAVARGTEVVTEQESAHRLRDLLRRLLDASAGSMPGLDAAARIRAGAAGVADVVSDIEAALIPVNRAAARRALARLARETLRAKQAGKLKRKRTRSVQDVVAPEPAAVAIARVVAVEAAPIVREEVAEAPAFAVAVEVTPLPEPESASHGAGDGEDVLNEASEPPPAMERASEDALAVAPQVEMADAAGAEDDEEIVVDWTAPPPTPAPIEVVVEVAPEPVAEPEDLSWSPPPQAVAATPEPVALAADLLPAVEPSPCPPAEAAPEEATAPLDLVESRRSKSRSQTLQPFDPSAGSVAPLEDAAPVEEAAPAPAEETAPAEWVEGRMQSLQPFDLSTFDLSTESAPAEPQPLDLSTFDPSTSSNSDITPIGEPEAYGAPEDLTVFDPSVVPTVTCEPPPVMEASEPAPSPVPVEAFVPEPPAPAPVAVVAPAPVAAVEAPVADDADSEVPRERRKSRRPVPAAAELDAAPRSSVEDLLASFGQPTDDRVIKAVAAGLKSLAGLDPTPPPPGTMTMRSPTPVPAEVSVEKRMPVTPEPTPQNKRSAGRNMAVPLVLLVLAVLVTIAAYRPDLLALALSSRF